MRSAENLLALSEDLKKLIFLNDFPFISQTVQKAREASIADARESQSRLVFVYREMESELLDLEEEYGSAWYLKNQDPLRAEYHNAWPPKIRKKSTKIKFFFFFFFERKTKHSQRSEKRGFKNQN